MASKYEKMVGQMIQGILVSDYKREVRTSKKTGKTYYKYMVQLNNVEWVTTTKFNKMLQEQPQEQPKPKKAQPKRAKKGVWFYQGQWYGKRDFKKLIATDDDAWHHWGMMLHMSNAMYTAAKEARSTADSLIKIFNEHDNLNVYCQQIYDSPEEYYQDWFDFEMKQLDGWVERTCRFDFAGLPDDMMEACKDTLKVTFIEEFSRAFKPYVFEHWSELQERQRQAWYSRQGENFEQYWERKNLGSTRRYGRNEYDDQFAGLDMKGIKRLHRKLSKQLHPDLGGSQAEFIKMQEAYERAVA